MIIGVDLERRNVIIPRQTQANDVRVFGGIGGWTLEFRFIEDDDYSIDSYRLFFRLLSIISSRIFIYPPSVFRSNTTRADIALWQI